MIPEWLTKGTKVRKFQTGLDYTIDCNSGSGLWYFTDGVCVIVLPYLKNIFQ